jgi:hypothetical protein
MVHDHVMTRQGLLEKPGQPFVVIDVQNEGHRIA